MNRSKALQMGGGLEAAHLALAKNVLSTSNAAMNVEQWAVNKAVHYNEWANFGKKDFEPEISSRSVVVRAIRERRRGCGAMPPSAPTVE